MKKAADMFCSDLKAITGREDAAKVENELRYSTKEALVVVGTLGHSKFIDQLVEKGKIDVSQIKGKWEHTLTACVRNPFNSGEDALVIAGSDRRAAAFGLMKLSEDCGMSPWNWWADVPPNRAESHIFWPSAVDRGETSIGRIDAPKVKYRGIFINDEDWALHEWAKNNFEKDGFGRIGPKTNEKIFELMLRLRMHIHPDLERQGISVLYGSLC